MAKSKKGKFKSGAFVLREMSMSRAYLALGGFAPQLLILFLMKRDIDRDYKCLNKDNITMTYAELENIFNHGRQNKGLPKDGITRTRIIRAFEQLMAKGFIKIVYRGGAYKQDKSIYALTDEWMCWQKGKVFSKREKDYRHQGYRKPKLPEAVNVTHENATHTHT